MPYNKKTRLFIFLFIGASFFSCTDIIELNLKNTEPKVIIEANLNMSDSSFCATITMSNDFYDSSEFLKLENASVSLQKNSDFAFLIPETEPGVYSKKGIVVNPSDEFLLNITSSEGEKYTAKASAPSPSQILYVIPSPFIPPGSEQNNQTEKYYQIVCAWKDTATVDNYYRIKPYINNTFLSDDYILVNDNYNNGDTILLVTIFEIYPGDTLSLELLTVNKEYYSFFSDVNYTLSQGPNYTTPYNPKGNFSGSAVGYFGIYGLSRFELLIY
jgi:hypothetical protein